MRQALAAAGVVVLAIGAYLIGVNNAPDDEPRQVALVEQTTTTTRRPTTTTTVRPTTTTLPPTTTTAPTTTTTWFPPQDSETYTYTPPVCDLACTRDILGGYVDPPTYTPPPCTPSTYTACDPNEPMNIPTYGCDYLEQTYSGDVKCVG